METIFIALLIGLPIIVIAFIYMAVKKVNEHKQSSEESMQELLRNVNSEIGKKEKK